MIYREVQQYTPFADKLDNFILLDLTLLNGLFIEQASQKRQILPECNWQQLKHRLQDTLLSCSDLNQKLKAIILPMECYFRKFEPIDKTSDAQCSPFGFLHKKYGNTLHIGLKMHSTQMNQFQILKQKGVINKIGIFSFDLQQQLLEQQLPFVRRMVKLIFKQHKKPIFHFCLILSSIAGLKLMKQEWLSYDFPIESCMLQTNLLNLIEKKFHLNFIDNWEAIAIKYTQVLKKYIPSALACVLQYHQINCLNQVTSELQDSILYCISAINKRNQVTLQKQFKTFYKTGISIPEIMLLKYSLQFKPDLYSSSKLKGSFDSVDLVKIYEALMGRFKMKCYSIQS